MFLSGLPKFIAQAGLMFYAEIIPVCGICSLSGTVYR